MRIQGTRTDLLRHIPRGGLAVEVGVFTGDFSAEILDIVQPHKLILIDTWEDYLRKDGETIYRQTVERFLGCPVQFWRGKSSDMLGQLANASVDFAYVDGDHTYPMCLADLEILLPKMRPGGWLCGHDYCECEQFGVVRAVAVFLDRHQHLSLELLTDEPLTDVIGSDRRYYSPQVSYNSYAIHIPIG